MRIPHGHYRDDIHGETHDNNPIECYNGSGSTQTPFRSALQNGNLQTLVLDETDRLLELGFRRDIQDILSCLNGNPQQGQQPSRQTLLFSATLSPAIKKVIDLAMTTSPLCDTHNTGAETNENGGSNNSYQMVDCVHDDDPATHTNTNTKQSYIVLPPERFWTGTMEFILELMAKTTTAASNDKKYSNTKKRKNKIIVFFEMTRLAQLYSRFLSLRLGHTSGVWEIHGKMHQRERTLVARRFRNAPHGVLLTSDVSARGVDYPDVSHVVQVGASQSRENYIHRLGRTGRAGKDGEGILVLPEMERDFIENDLEGLDLVADKSLQQRLLSKNNKKSKGGGHGIRKLLEDELGMLKQDLRDDRDASGMVESLNLAYHSLVSYYFQTRRRRRRGGSGGDNSNDNSSSPDDATIVETLNRLVEDFGLQELPAISFKRAKNMGIERLEGLNIRKDWEHQTTTNGWGKNYDTGNTEGGFRRKKHGEFDDWFGVTTQNGGGPPGRGEHQNKSPPPRRKNNNHRDDDDTSGHGHGRRSSPERFAKRNATPTKKKTKTKRKPKNFYDWQIYDHSGDCSG